MESNNNPLWFRKARSVKYFFHRQLWHLLALLLLLPMAWSLAAPAMGSTPWLGVSDRTWFWLAVGLAVLHQVLVWIVFRGQLGWAVFTKIFGDWDLLVWGLLFLPLLLARPFLVFGLAASTPSTLALPRPLAVPLALLLLLPALYTFWSVKRYFGVVRALGADHFRMFYRTMPLVDKGAFRCSSNAMYAFGFLLLWSIALFFGSQAALGVAFFEHAYVWVHYHCTEKPDMAMIYGSRS